MEYTNKTAIIILTHKMGFEIKKIQEESIKIQNHNRFLVYYLQGDPNQELEVTLKDDTLTFNIPDNYESLSKKTYLGIKYIKEKHPDIDGIFKTDDNLQINLDNLEELLKNNTDKYWGNVAHITDNYYSDYHFGKCENSILNTTMEYVKPCAYCSGGGYYIHKSLFEFIINDKEYYEMLYEDCATGISLNKHGIYPVQKPVKNKITFWS
jgi:hypothetical protein